MHAGLVTLVNYILTCGQDMTHCCHAVAATSLGFSKNGQVLHRVLRHVFIAIAIHPVVFFLLTCTGVLIIGRLVLKSKLRLSESHFCRAGISKQGHAWVVNDTNYEAAAWTCRDVFTVRELLARNFEAVAARTRVVEHSFLFVPSHVTQFRSRNVIGTHGY